MFVDASALVAIIADESDGAVLAGRLKMAERRCTSAIALYEATLALVRIRDATTDEIGALLIDFIEQSQVEIIPITAEIGRIAIKAFARFGRGKHAARLNMGDCFAYACARSRGVRLLCKGDDFRLTDIGIA